MTIIPNDQGNRITPSYVAFLDTGERLVGDAAKNQAIINPKNTIFDVKRLIGRKFSDKSVQADKKLVPYDIVGDRDQPRVRVDDKLYAPEEISAMVLRKMKETAEMALGHEVTRAVVTVPGTCCPRNQINMHGHSSHCAYSQLILTMTSDRLPKMLVSLLVSK